MEAIIISAFVSLVVGLITAYVTSSFKIREENTKWKKEFALKFAELLSERPDIAEKAAIQFGIAVFVVKSPKLQEQGVSSEKYFITPGTRLVVGRGNKCNIILDDPTVSRIHFAFYANDKKVWVELLSNSNPVLVNNQPVKKKWQLESGDVIKVGIQSSSTIEFINLM